MTWIIIGIVVGIIIGVVAGIIDDCDEIFNDGFIGMVVGGFLGLILWGLIALVNMPGVFPEIEENVEYRMVDTNGYYLVRNYNAAGGAESCSFKIVDDLYVEYEITEDCDDIVIKPVSGERFAVRTGTYKYEIQIGLNEVLDYKLDEN